MRHCIDSVCGQDFSSWEVVISDDGSSDGTADMMSHGPHDNRIRFIAGGHSGIPSVGRNRALNEARGRFIVPLDDDDMLTPNSLSLRLKAYFLCSTEFPDAFVCGAAYMLEGDCGYPDALSRMRNGLTAYGMPGIGSMPAWEKIHAQTVLAPRTLFDAHGGWNEDPVLRFGEDKELWARWIQAGSRPIYIERPVCFYRLHDNWQLKVTPEQRANRIARRNQIIRDRTEQAISC